MANMAGVKHRGWLYDRHNGILAATYNLAEGGASVLATNTALNGVLVGTPVTPALAVDSIIIANAVASGDILIALNRGGNSENYLFGDASAGTLTLYAPNGALTLTPTTDVVIDSGKGLLTGSTSQLTISDGDGSTNLIPELQGLGVGTAFAGGSLVLATFNATNTRAVAPGLRLVKGAAATQVATSALADNEVVGVIIAYGSDSADFETPVGSIEFVVDDAGAPGAGAIGGSIEFYTTADGGETLTKAVTITSSQVIQIEDGLILALGTTQDQAMVNRATSLNANTALTGVIVGTPVVAAIPANSLIVSNVTADGDQVFMGQTGGNSQEWLRYDASAKLVVFNEDSGDVDFRVESNGNANMLVIDAGNDAIGIGGAAVANQTVTVTNAAVAATGRVMKLSGTIAAAALTDGYGAFEVDITLSGSPTDHSAAASAWVNITGGTVPAGTYICARNDGIYEEAAATVTNAKLVFGARMQYIVTDTDGLRFPWSINTNNAAITALIDCNNFTDLGTVANAGATAATLLPIARNAGGTLKYVLLYDLA